jgi:hypothetical protein
MKNKHLVLLITGCLVCATAFAQDAPPPATNMPELKPPSFLNMHNSDANTGPFYLNVSTPFQATPMYTDNYGTVSDYSGNSGSDYYSEKSSPLSFFGLKMEPVFRLVNSDNIKLQVSASFTYTNSLILSQAVSLADSSSNTTGVTEFDYTYGGELDLGAKYLKVVGMFEGGYRNISYSTEVDDTNDAYSSSTTETATANYNYIRYGAGLNIRLNSDGDAESYLKLMYYNEKPSYSTLKIAGYGLELKSIINITFQYFPNYPVAGTNSYAVDNPAAKTDFWYLSFGKSFSF